MTTALVLIDAQQNMLVGDEAVPSAPDVGPALADLLARARAAGAVVVHVQNDGGPDEPDEPHTPGWELVHAPEPGEHVVRKGECDAFAGTDLAGLLSRAGVRTAVLAGMQSQYCVAATARGALGQGLDTVLVAGAHATYDEDEDAHAISRATEQDLRAEGVRVLPGAEVAFTAPPDRAG
ncbi:isochorismatase family protein [Nocardiopsis halophila]|uniref:isochorismatase family protein n=1 Tax=Nocardiopsis halophila TaxID=141692 RepID=UPI000349A01A|nr:isochorismatase family protein [Nocardiopsis halophila]